MQSLFGYLYKRILRQFRVYEISRFLASHLKVIYSNYSVGFSKFSEFLAASSNLIGWPHRPIHILCILQYYVTMTSYRMIHRL